MRAPSQRLRRRSCRVPAFSYLPPCAYSLGRPFFAASNAFFPKRPPQSTAEVTTATVLARRTPFQSIITHGLVLRADKVIKRCYLGAVHQSGVGTCATSRERGSTSAFGQPDIEPTSPNDRV